MNSLIRLWNIIAGLADSLTDTKKLIDMGNARMKKSLDLDAPPLKIIEVEIVSTPSKKAKIAA